MIESVTNIAGRIDRDERVDRPQLHATERPDDKVKGDYQSEHDAESEAFLARSWRKAREDEMLAIRDTGNSPTHRSELSRAPLDEGIVVASPMLRSALESYTANPAFGGSAARYRRVHPGRQTNVWWTSGGEWRILS